MARDVEAPLKQLAKTACSIILILWFLVTSWWLKNVAVSFTQTWKIGNLFYSRKHTSHSVMVCILPGWVLIWWQHRIYPKEHHVINFINSITFRIFPLLCLLVTTCIAWVSGRWLPYTLLPGTYTGPASRVYHCLLHSCPWDLCCSTCRPWVFDCSHRSTSGCPISLKSWCHDVQDRLHSWANFF